MSGDYFAAIDVQRWPWMFLADERELIELTSIRNGYALGLTKAKLDYNEACEAATKACHERASSETKLKSAMRELVDECWIIERPDRLAALLIDYKGAELVQTEALESRESATKIRDEAQKAFDDVCAKIEALSKRIAGDRS